VASDLLTEKGIQTAMKKLLILMLALTLALSLAACGGNGNDSPNTDDNSNISGSGEADTTTATTNPSDEGSVTQQEAPAENVKSDGYDKFIQLKIGMTESEVNAILGEPARVDKAYYYYNATVNGKDLELEVWINKESGLVTYLNGNFSGSDHRDEFADSATDLSKADGLDSGEISTYDDCVNAFKTPGFLMNIKEDGVISYLWVNTVGGYMRVTFKADGSVKSFNGFC